MGIGIFMDILKIIKIGKMFITWFKLFFINSQINFILF